MHKAASSVSPAERGEKDEEIEMEPGNKSDYRRVQIDRKPSCQPPPTLGKARNNSACKEVVLKRFPAALLQLADRLCSARLCCWWWITTCSQWWRFCVKRLEIQTWSGDECEMSGFMRREAQLLRRWHSVFCDFMWMRYNILVIKCEGHLKRMPATILL